MKFNVSEEAIKLSEGQKNLFSLFLNYADANDRDNQTMNIAKQQLAAGAVTKDIYDYLFDLSKNPETKKLYFDDSQVKRMQRLYSFLTYSQISPFLTKMMTKLTSKKELKFKEFLAIDSILNSGKSSYQSGMLTTKN